ncbi:hypothetical protein PGT21_028513 [Puccinia graminis f. sp. tritici]|uniref:Uncharacterized protein n=1 Tax=Puccinia graminis f. sp. tritici TaxID=56615 RepID=A0A5B0NNT5_PUCGR|nr:hypothetical protein PGT21_028513 [Puccinia graminis f. sp. tritici]
MTRLRGLPSWLSIWLTGWSLLHTCQGRRHGSSNTNARFPPPWAYNITWISGCFLAIVLAAYACNKFSLMSSELGLDLRNLHEMMMQRSGLRADPEIQTLASEMQDEIQNFHAELAAQKKVLTGWVTGWMAFGIVLVLFYIFILQLLVRKIRKVLRLCEAEHFRFLSQTCDQALHNEKLKIVEKSLAPLHALRQELRLLMFSSFSIMMVLLAEVSICACRYWSLKTEHLSVFMLEFSLISAMIPSVFMSPVLLIQCWKGLISHAPIHDPPERAARQQKGLTDGMEMGRINKAGWSCLMDKHTAETSSQNSTKFQLPAFYQRLFWWYANPDTDDVDCLHIQSNYPPSTVQLSTASLVSVDPECSRLELRSIQLSEVPDSHHH